MDCKIFTLNKMPKTRKHRGGGYGTSQQMFNPAVLPPATMFAAPSSAPTGYEIRPVLPATFHAGGTRKLRGGFSPSVMGGFLGNAKAAIVPLALYALYKTVVPTTRSGHKSRKSRNNRNSRKSGGSRNNGRK